ncbi:MAG TPA: exosortase-associated EpsI family protein [Phycisphaerae bacterium]|nr:exosortase-associated EpsI family protein [Phycisphaerae bacterium]
MAEVDGAGARRSALRRSVMAAVILLTGLGVGRALEAALSLTFDKPYLPLPKPLTELRSLIGEHARYRAVGDENLDPDIVATLGTKEYLLRHYVDTTKKPGEVGYDLRLNLNYYGTGSATPHVPEICWAGAGMQEAADSKQEFVVKGVRRKSGKVEDIKMRMICFLPNQTDASGLSLGADMGNKTLNVAYLFEVNGKCVSQPQEVTGEFWKASSKYAYHTKIEVTVPAYCTPQEAQQAISDFIRASLADIEDCLPDPQDGSPAKDSGTGTQETR